jgi:hypothetical protein
MSKAEEYLKDVKMPIRTKEGNFYMENQVLFLLEDFAKPQWISVKEKRPDEDVTVWCLTDNNGLVRQYPLAINFVSYQWYDYEGNPFKGNVTHWQSLPTPPNEQ